MAAASTTTATRSWPPYAPLLMTYLSVVVLGTCLAWAYLSMRAVMGVGGSCASGGAYEIASPCPDGSWLISVAIPLVLVAMFVGTGFASVVGAPGLLLPGWAILFTSLGWNFLDFGFDDGVSVGWLLCGVLFWAMAAPAWWAMTRGPRSPNEKILREGQLWDAGSPRGALAWWGVYLVLGAAGAFLGLAVYTWAS